MAGEMDTVRLVVAAREGDRAALEQLFRLHLPVAYSAARRLLSGPDADDVVQESLLAAVRHLGDLQDPAAFRAWLLTIVLRKARGHRLDRLQEQTWLAGSDPDERAGGSGVVHPGDRAVAQVVLRQQRREVAAAVNWLDADDRELLALWWLEVTGHLDRAGLAVAAGETVAYTAVRLQRLRGRLHNARLLVRALAAQRLVDRCAEFRPLFAEWDGKPGPTWRKRLLRHVTACPRCLRDAEDLVAPERLLAVVPLLAVPPALLGTAVDIGTVSAVGGTGLGSGFGIARFGESALVKPLGALAVTATVLGGLLGAYVSTTPDSGPVPPAAAPPPPAAEPSARSSPSLSPAAPSPSATPVAYGGPLVITKGGTYRGNWASTDPVVPAVSVATTEPVVIEGCNVRGPGHLIAVRTPDHRNHVFRANVTVRNCNGYGVDPKTPGQARGMFLLAADPKRVIVENNYFEHTRGIVLFGGSTPGAAEVIRILRNRARDIDGRFAGAQPRAEGGVCPAELNQSPHTTKSGMCGASFVHVGGFRAARVIEIGWNEVINTAGESDSNVNIDIWNSSGTPTTPIRVHDNYIQGAYPADPARDLTSGAGIGILGDSSDPAQAPAYVHAENNQIVSTANVGILIAAGHDNLLTGNRVIVTGLLPDGRPLSEAQTGLYVWDCCYRQVPAGIFRDNVARGNTVGVSGPNGRGTAFKLDDCAPGRCVDNTTMPRAAVTRALERAEYRRWLAKLATNGTRLGPLDPGSVERANLSRPGGGDGPAPA